MASKTRNVNIFHPKLANKCFNEHRKHLNYTTISIKLQKHYEQQKSNPFCQLFISYSIVTT